MNNTKSLLVPMAACSLLLVACSGSDDSDNTSADTVSAFDGIFLRECLDDEDGSEELLLSIDGTEGVLTLDEFEGSGCVIEQFDVDIQIELAFGDLLIFPATGFSGQEVDLIFGDVTLTPATSEVALALNTSSFCGITTFAEGESSVIPDGCDAFSDFDGTSFNVIALEDETIFLGATEALLNTPEDRPTELDITEAFVRIP